LGEEFLAADSPEEDIPGNYFWIVESEAELPTMLLDAGFALGPSDHRCEVYHLIASLWPMPSAKMDGKLA